MANASFSQLLTSNYPANDSDIPEIESAILDAQKHLFSLNEKLVQLELAILDIDHLPHENPGSSVASERDLERVRLLVRREKQHKYILRLRSTLSALRRFPPEVLTLIFESALPHGQNGVPMDGTSSLWRLSYVCRLWREIICQGMQQVWSTIDIDHMKVERHNLTSTLLTLALRRSGTRPLSIRFRFSHRNSLDILSEAEEKCLRLITDESFRWKNLELDRIPIATLDSLTISIRNHVPLLQSLVVENIPASHSVDTPSTAAGFEIAPSLKHFSLSGYFRPSRFLLPWSQLVSYEGNFRDIKDFFVVLESANNLTTCDVFLRNFHPGFIAPHPHMETLRIRGALEGLSRLRLPSLRTLVLDELIVQDLGTISLFVERTPSISSLEVYIPHESGGGDSLDILSNFFTACENISSLVLMGEVDMRSVCSLLRISDSNAGRVYMPQLRHLSLSILETRNLEFIDLLAEMVESRRGSVVHDGFVSLSSLTLHTLRMPDALLRRLKPLQETLGLRVVVGIKPTFDASTVSNPSTATSYTY